MGIGRVREAVRNFFTLGVRKYQTKQTIQVQNQAIETCRIISHKFESLRNSAASILDTIRPLENRKISKGFEGPTSLLIS